MFYELLQPWAVRRSRLEQLMRLKSTDASVPFLQQGTTGKTKLLYKIDAEGTAIIPISGILMRWIPALFRAFGIEATSYAYIETAVRQAARDPRVKRIHLEIDSPGGTVAGVDDTVAALRNAGKVKQVTAHIQDVGLSAAYWLASQAHYISAGKTAEVGEIGIYTVYVDSSKQVRNKGIRVIVIRSGPHKGMGIEGDSITREQISAVQEIVDSLAGYFIGDVARGRNRSMLQVERLANGRSWISLAARENGLIDEVQ